MKRPYRRILGGLTMVAVCFVTSYVLVFLVSGGICGTSGSRAGLGVVTLMLGAFLPLAAGIYLRSLWVLGALAFSSGPALLAEILGTDKSEPYILAAMIFAACVVVSFVSGRYGSRVEFQSARLF